MAEAAGETPLGPGSRRLDLIASDGVALRAAHLPVAGARGVVLLLQGRTEFLEKYAGVAGAFVERGYAVAAIDWRGQGGSARATGDPMLGHVESFAAYQRDLDAFVAAVERLEPGAPRTLFAHSMGGAIALGGLLREAALAERAIFSAPMWGLAPSALLRALARGLSWAATGVGLGERYALGGGPTPYVFEGFDGNLLTSDRAEFEKLVDATRRVGPFALGGPSWRWAREALREIDALGAAGPIPVPSLVVAGSEERVTDLDAMRARAAAPGARFAMIDGARHEPFIESPPRRAALWRAIDDFLADDGRAPRAA